MTIAERYGLPVSTSSPIAAGHYQEGMDRLLSYGLGADDSFAGAVAADDGLALAHAGAALFAFSRHEDAVRPLRRRLDRRPSPPDLSWLGQAQAGIADGARRG